MYGLKYSLWTLLEYKAALWNTKQHYGIQSSIMEYKEEFWNKKQYYGIKIIICIVKANNIRSDSFFESSLILSR